MARIGLDIAKRGLRAHGVAEHGNVGVGKRLPRSQVLRYLAQRPACRIGIATCGRAHYWGRALQKLGHEVRLIAGQLLRPSRTKPTKDRKDAAAICEAVSRRQRRVIPIKTGEQQAELTIQRARELLVRERTAVVNQIRGVLLEYGIVIAAGIHR